MKIKSSIIAFLGIMALLIVPMYQANYNNEDYLDIVTKSFQSINADFNALNIQGWAQISKKGLAKEDLYDIYSQITSELEINSQPTTYEEYDDFISFYQSEQIHSDTVIEISLQSFQTQGQESGVYLGIQVISTTMNDSKKYYEAISKIFNNLNVSTDIGVTIVGTKNKHLNQNERFTVLAKALLAVDAEVVEGINTDQIMSYSGYTKKSRQHINVNKNKINLNIAIRYHEIDDKTYIHIGAPLIYQEY